MKLYLPTNHQDCVDAMKMMVASAKAERVRHVISWEITYWYLQGCRKFKVLSYETGDVLKTLEGPPGSLRFTYEEILRQFSRELGRRMSADLRPLVTPAGAGLDQMRGSSMSQVFLDAHVDAMEIQDFARRLHSGLMRYGTMGIQHQMRGDDPNKPGSHYGELVYPWELLPVPGAAVERSQMTAIARNRWLPLERLRKDPRFKSLPKAPGSGRASEEDKRLGAVSVPYGKKPPTSFMVREGSSGTPRYTATSNTTGKPAQTEEAYVEVTELWSHDEFGRVFQHAILVGEFLVSLEDFSKTDTAARPWIPLHACADIDVGGFWGRSFTSYLLPFNDQIEQMLASLFTNVRDLDLMGVSLYPADWNIPATAFKATGRPKFIPYTQSPGLPDGKTHQVGPMNAGDFPGRIAASTVQLYRQLAGDSPLQSGEAPGRVDGGPGLGLIHETSSSALVPTTTDIERAMAGLYRTMLATAREAKTGPSAMLQLSLTSDNTVGIVVSPDGSVALGDGMNVLPDPATVNISIRARNPQLSTNRKQELLTMRSQGLLSDQDLIWYNFVEHLGLPLSGEDILAETRKAILRNLQQFGDGKTPQEVVVSEFDNHPLQLERIARFMARPEFGLASPEVRAKFEDRRRFHEAYGKQGLLPEGAPRPEEAGLPFAGRAPGMGGPIPEDLQASLSE